MRVYVWGVIAHIDHYSKFILSNALMTIIIAVIIANLITKSFFLLFLLMNMDYFWISD